MAVTKGDPITRAAISDLIDKLNSEFSRRNSSTRVSTPAENSPISYATMNAINQGRINVSKIYKSGYSDIQSCNERSDKVGTPASWDGRDLTQTIINSGEKALAVGNKAYASQYNLLLADIEALNAMCACNSYGRVDCSDYTSDCSECSEMTKCTCHGVTYCYCNAQCLANGSACGCYTECPCENQCYSNVTGGCNNCFHCTNCTDTTSCNCNTYHSRCDCESVDSCFCNAVAYCTSDCNDCSDCSDCTQCSCNTHHVTCSCESVDYCYCNSVSYCTSDCNDCSCDCNSDCSCDDNCGCDSYCSDCDCNTHHESCDCESVGSCFCDAVDY